MVGGVGAAAIAAVGLGQFLIFVAMTVFWGLSTGTTVVIAHLRGAGRRTDARRAAFVAAARLRRHGGGGDAARRRLRGSSMAALMGAGADVMAHGGSYIRLVFLYFGFTAGLNILSAIMHGQGDTRTPMTAIMLVNILHVVIAWPLIYGRLGLPRLGVIGAAYAINFSEGDRLLLPPACRRSCKRVR